MNSQRSPTFTCGPAVVRRPDWELMPRVRGVQLFDGHSMRMRKPG